MSKRYQAAILTASYNGLKVPNAPTIGTATAGSGSASVTFTAPSNIGGGAITSYTAISSPGGITGTGSSSPIAVSGLTNDTAYTFTVVATNAYGTGPASAASNSVTPVVNYIESVFSTYLYVGTSAAQTITNGINLSANGGMIWFKDRTVGNSHRVFDTARGASSVLTPNITNAAFTSTNMLTSFNTTGFSVGTDTSGGVNDNGDNFVSWSFQEKSKFFDVVTYMGTGSPVTVNHNLGSTPGCIIIKATSNTGNWHVWHRSVVDGSGYGYLVLNSTAATAGGKIINSTSSTDFVVASGLSDVGYTYVCYVFAHDAGGFGLTGTDNVISCGSYTGVGSTQQDITLGYEPQWVMIKRTDTTNSWIMVDNMRGFFQTADNALEANSSNAEAAGVSMSGAMQPTATGFHLYNANSAVNASGGTYIYIAIRRGPMKVPTTGTSVYTPITYNGNGTSQTITGSVGVPDLGLGIGRSGGAAGSNAWYDRLRGKELALRSTLTNTEYNASPGGEGTMTNVMNGMRVENTYGILNDASTAYVLYFMSRAPGFFDEVCYTGTGVNTTLNHNLGVVPELMIFKTRTGTARAWGVYSSAFGVNKKLLLNTTAAVANDSFFVNATPTASVFYPGNADESNEGGNTYVAYLFATCPGVSKVGSYTGTGALQTVNCGFAAGARFVLIKRTDSTGDWYTYDSARGITSSNDPYLFLNSTAAEVTNTNYVDTDVTGFKITAAAPAGLNAAGGTYIFLAIA